MFKFKLVVTCAMLVSLMFSPAVIAIADTLYDDAPAINAALQLGSVQLEAHRTYNIRSPLDIGSSANIVLSAPGWDTILLVDNDSCGVYIHNWGCGLRNLTVKITKGAGRAGTRPNAVVAEGTLHWIIDNANIVGDDSVGDDGSDLRQNGILALNVAANGHIGAGNDISYNRIGVNFYSTPKDGGVVGEANSNTLVSSNLHHNRLYGVLSYNSSHNVITGNTMEGNGVAPVKIIRTQPSPFYGNDNTVVGNNFEGNYTYNLWIVGSEGNIITGNQMEWASKAVLLAQNCGGNIFETTAFHSRGDGLVFENCHDWITASIISDYGYQNSNKCYALSMKSCSDMQTKVTVYSEGLSNHTSDILIDSGCRNIKLTGFWRGIEDYGTNTDYGQVATQAPETQQVMARAWLNHPMEDMVANVRHQVKFNALNFDRGAGFDTSLGAYITPNDGYYHADISVCWKDDNMVVGARFDLELWRNSEVVATNVCQSTLTHDGILTPKIGDIVYLNRGDTLCVTVTHNASRLQALNPRSDWTYMAIYRIGGLE